MAYDLEEQEQIASLKAWWKDYGTLVVAAVAAAAVSAALWQGWRFYQSRQAVGAVTLYEQLDRAEHAGDHKKVRDIAGQITGSYGSTTYAIFAAFSAAKASFETGDLAGAKSQLQWVIDNAKEDEIRDVARLRLAGVLLDEKNTEAALKLVEVKSTDVMAGQFADLKGDILLAQGKRADARNAYQQALDRSEAGSPNRTTLQMKLDSLGETSAAAK